MWMQEAYDRYHGEVNKTTDLGEILDHLAYTAAQQGNIDYALELTKELVRLDPTHERAANNMQYYENIIEERGATNEDGEGKSGMIVNKRLLDEYRDGEEFYNYERLCRGEDTHAVPRNLKCRFVHRKNPLLWLNPLREEVLHDRPKISFYHNILSDKEMNFIRSYATPRLGRATIQNPQTGKLETAPYRISKSAWLRDYEDPIIRRISNRIEAATGLDMSTAEELQVANYGIGGHYEPHFDFARSDEMHAFQPEIGNRVATMLFYKPEPFKHLGTGNRIATMLFYMSDVQQGGATVFPHIGAKVFPKKGGGVFWYNLFRSGDGDYDTRHAACPVLEGVKWVSNKWIHERGQEFRRPCSKNPKL